MMHLVAHFNVELPGQCLVAWPEGDEIRFSCTIDEFDVVIQLVPASSGKSKGSDDEYWTYILHNALVWVSREEEEAPPVVRPDEKGRRDYSIQSDYFSERIRKYGAVAREAINRLIRFFKFKLKTPFLNELPNGHHCFENATWTDASGNEVGKGTVVFVAKGVLGLWGQLGVQKLAPESKESLRAALRDPTVPTLYEEILSDAQTALFEGNIRRAVLELAIACEIIIKRKIFSEESPAGAAFDYLEDKSQVRVRVLDFIDRIAVEAFGKSFRVDQGDHFNNIDHLFRCRNKVAHRGILSYRDDSGASIQVDYETVSSWWISVSTLIEWLNA